MSDESASQWVLNISNSPKRLYLAYNRDLPVTFTQYEEPQILDRNPIYFCNFLEYIYKYCKSCNIGMDGENEGHRSGMLDVLYSVFENAACGTNSVPSACGINSTHTAVDLIGSGKRQAMTNESEHGRVDTTTAVEASTSSTIDAIEPSDAGDRDTHPNSPYATDDTLDTGSGGEKEEQQEQEEIVLARDGALSERTTDETALEIDEDVGAQARQRVLEYLFSQPHFASASTNSAFASSPSHPSASASHVHPGVPSWEDVQQLFFGMRQIPCADAEYLTTLYSWALEKQRTNRVAATSMDSKEVAPVRIAEQVPEYIRSLLLSGRALVSTTTKRHSGANVDDTQKQHQQQHNEDRSENENGSRLDGTVHEPESIVKLFAYPSHPVVKSKAEDVLHALVPPRLLEFFDIAVEDARRVFHARERCRRRLSELQRELALRGTGTNINVKATTQSMSINNNDDEMHGHPVMHSSGTSKDHTRPRDREQLLREYCDMQYQLSRHDNIVVGEMLLIIQRASCNLPTRPAMWALEKQVNEALKSSRARCWGVPLSRSSISALSQDAIQPDNEAAAAALLATSQSAAATGSRTQAATHAVSSIAGSPTKTDAASTANTQPVGRRRVFGAALPPVANASSVQTTRSTNPHATKTIVGNKGTKHTDQTNTLAATLSPSSPHSSSSFVAALTEVIPGTAHRRRRATASTARGGKEASHAFLSPHLNARFFSTTIKPPIALARPSALSPTAGGTVSVIPELNVRELSAERHVIYFHLLAEELLRQVTLSLPERGVLLARVLNESTHTMHVYDSIVAASTRATGDSLIDGEERRTESAVRARELESEVAALRERRAALAVRQKSLQAWVSERVEQDEARHATVSSFYEVLMERVKKQTAMVMDRMDQERHELTNV